MRLDPLERGLQRRRERKAFLRGFWGEKFWAQWYALGKGNSGIYDTLWGTKTDDRKSGEGQRELASQATSEASSLL